jgi:hypothetical protein
MKLISTKVHGVLDYLVSVLVIASPWLFGFTRDGAETWVPVILGISSILYSLFTNYEWGASRTLSMKTHLTLDMLSGVLLAASPWIFGFNDYVYLPHLILGVFEILAALVTENEPRAASNFASHEHASHSMLERR